MTLAVLPLWAGIAWLALGLCSVGLACYATWLRRKTERARDETVKAARKTEEAARKIERLTK